MGKKFKFTPEQDARNQRYEKWDERHGLFALGHRLPVEKLKKGMYCGILVFGLKNPHQWMCVKGIKHTVTKKLKKEYVDIVIDHKRCTYDEDRDVSRNKPGEMVCVATAEELFKHYHFLYSQVDPAPRS